MIYRFKTNELSSVAYSKVLEIKLYMHLSSIVEYLNFELH